MDDERNVVGYAAWSVAPLRQMAADQSDLRVPSTAGTPGSARPGSSLLDTGYQAHEWILGGSASRPCCASPTSAPSKDYALSYLLAGIARVEELREGLILKGATALKKMYFGDYRFSEDLDFSTRQETLVLDVDEAMGQAVREMDGLLQEQVRSA